MSRHLLSVLVLFVSLIAVPTIAQHSSAPATGHAATAAPGHETAVALDPDAALTMLLKGNERFVRGTRTSPNLSREHRIQTARNGQKPFVSILSCSDSRVPLEHVFDAGIGDLFVIRVAGNVADKAEIGSLEYGVGHLGTSLLVVLGHTKCGAVTAVVTGAKVGGNITSFTDNIAPAAEKTRKLAKGLSPDELVLKSIKANVWQSVEDIYNSSDEICAMVAEGKLKVVGALYDLESGKVTNLGVHVQQEKLVRKIEKEPDL